MDLIAVSSWREDSSGLVDVGVASINHSCKHSLALFVCQPTVIGDELRLIVIIVIFKTSNGLERYNHHFKGIVSTSHPNLEVFAADLQHDAGEVVQRIENIKKRQEIAPKYKATVLLEILEEYESFKFKEANA